VQRLAEAAVRSLRRLGDTFLHKSGQTPTIAMLVGREPVLRSANRPLYNPGELLGRGRIEHRRPASQLVQPAPDAHIWEISVQATSHQL